MPALADLPARLDAVLRVVYLVFNEGCAASAGDALTRAANGRALELTRQGAARRYLERGLAELPAG